MGCYKSVYIDNYNKAQYAKKLRDIALIATSIFAFLFVIGVTIYEKLT